ncbi:MAG TPA: GGDEF domain-containing protein, partial [Candidatus Goldiibacteriota bacterium]|nr:GGDEF domain-containing protein [Candidatus Goldiibacteriota bacterium]
ALRKSYYALQEKAEALEIEVKTDPLTGLYNRRAINSQLKHQIELSIRSGQVMAVIMADIDHFKKINDTYGHQCGDEVLKNIAQILKEKTRSINIVGRYGGEEFIIIGPISDHKTAFYAAERLRVEVENTVFKCPDSGSEFRLTISAGVAVWHKKIKTAKEMVRLADEALYAAKKSGRNRVIMAGEI